MSADVGIATRLRRAELPTREVDGWKTRGRDFAGAAPTFSPKGGVNHHTAGPPKSDGKLTPSLRIIIQGRSDLPGPLANVYMGYDDVFYVVAAGTCNHAGAPDGGVIRGMHGNSDAYGLEVEHTGKGPLSAARIELLARAWAAILDGRSIPASQLVQHWEWAPSRKVDLGTNMHPSTTPTAGKFRQMVAAEIVALQPVGEWTVSFLNKERKRVEDETKSPSAWAQAHPKAYQRGKVFFDPNR